MNEASTAIRCLRRVATERAGQWLYLFGDEGMVYSETQNRFAGLDATGVAAYRAFEAGATVDDLRHVRAEDSDSVVSAHALGAISALTQGIFPIPDCPTESPRLEPREFVTSRTTNSKTESIEIGGISILLEYPSGPLEPLCRDYFRNCPPATRPPGCHLRAQRAGNCWTICVNGREVLSLQREEQLGLGLMHAARAMLYAKADYDLGLHAAAVAHGDCGVLLCAPRECGKSTLAAYLVAHGFDLLTDEPAFLHLDSCTVPSLPLPISLKQGSWPFLGEIFPQMSSGPVHVRSDGMKISLVHPPVECRPDRSRQLTHILFPQYLPSGEGHVVRLSPLRTLELLNEGALLLADNLGRNKFEKFLELVCRIPAHKIRYRSLKEAHEMLHEIGCS
jgi:hypothetical protein